jgi:hypothetical protein
MLLRLMLLLLLLCCSCAPADVPADSALSAVKIIYVEAAPDQIARVKVNAPFTDAKAQVLAYSFLDRSLLVCVVVLPVTPDAAYRERLRQHEERHCRGEQHPGRGRFADEYSFAYELQRRPQ